MKTIKILHLIDSTQSYTLDLKKKINLGLNIHNVHILSVDQDLGNIIK